MERPPARQTSERRPNVPPNPTTDARQQANQPSISSQPLDIGNVVDQPSVGLPPYDKLTFENVLTYLGIATLSDNPELRTHQLSDVLNILNCGIATVKSSLKNNRNIPLEYRRLCLEINNLEHQKLRLYQLMAVLRGQKNTADGIIEEADDMEAGARPEAAAVLIEKLD